MVNNYRKKAIEIIKNEGLKKWLEVRDVINLEAINHGYCVDIEGCCEEDRCDCVKYRGLTLEEVIKKLNERRSQRVSA